MELLGDDDREGAPLVMVINESAAKKYWPGEEALGKPIEFNDKEHTVVGIVGDIRHLGPETPPRQECYLPMSVNKDQRLSGDTVTLEGYMDRLIAQRRFNMALLALFGILGLVISTVGIYGVMAYIVAQRTNEIGVRMALGATAGNVVSMVLKRAAVLVAAGLVIGGAASWYLSASVKTFLFDVEPNDVRVFVAAVLTLAAAGLVASAVPARRAATVDPVVALRHE